MRIAIIGRIGSGKSEALKIARELGLATLSADEINGELLEDEGYISLLGEEFPRAVVNGRVDRAALAREVFGDAEARARLNALAHPRILERIEQAKEDPLVVEVPLYVESGAGRLFDKTLLVTCSDDVRRARLLTRGMAPSDIEARLLAQRDSRLEEIADVIVRNDGSREELAKKVSAAFSRLFGGKR